MSSKFQPLQVGNFPKAQASFVPKVLPPPGAETPAPVSQSNVSAPSATAPSAHTAPTVDLKKENDRVVEIIVRCGCGETIRLECS